MHIRPEKATDISDIEQVIYQAFQNHPHHPPGALPTEHQIVSQLRNAGALHLYLVAEIDTKVVGHIAFSPVSLLSAPALNWLGLGPVSVLPGYQKQGIGAQLIRQGLAEAQKQPIDGIVLLGDPAYYQRFGFQADSRLVLPNVPPAYFLAYTWQDATQIPHSEVKYHESFQ